MSLYESNLGKRSGPSKAGEGHGQEKESHSKKRDNKERETASSSIQQIIDMSQVSGGDFGADAGNFSKFPEITERTKEVLRAKGITSLFPI